MNQRNSGSRDYRPDYKVLGMDDQANANWATARENYRRLVLQWHPDKFAQRPRERDHAQQQFIALTKSYTRLRNFHKLHGHLPFESTLRARQKNDTKKQSTSSKPRNSQSKPQKPNLESGFLGREPVARTPLNQRLRQHTGAVALLVGGVIVIGTITTFFVLENKANQVVLERAETAIKEAPPSEFMPSNAEIRKYDAKGAFVQQPR